MTWDRRRYNRFPLSMHGTLEILDGTEPRLAFGITITDVGSGGVGLIAGGNLAIGAKVRLSVQNGILEGVVVHCHPEIGHYTAGIAVDHDSGVLARLQWMASLSPAGHPKAIHPLPAAPH